MDSNLRSLSLKYNNSGLSVLISSLWWKTKYAEPEAEQGVLFSPVFLSSPPPVMSNWVYLPPRLEITNLSYRHIYSVCISQPPSLFVFFSLSVPCEIICKLPPHYFIRIFFIIFYFLYNFFVSFHIDESGLCPLLGQSPDRR